MSKTRPHTTTPSETPQYSVIYSFDCTRRQSVKCFQPPRVRKWDCTEGDEQYEFDYDEELEGGKHRKYCAVLTPEELAEFCEECGLEPSTTPTMGSLGAPGCGPGLAPAISFDYQYSGDGYDPIYANAYVTPLGVPLETRQLCIDGELDELWEFTIPVSDYRGFELEPIVVSRMGADPWDSIVSALVEGLC